VELAPVTEPEKELTARFEAQYQKYRKIYPALRDVFRALR
jgi:sugar (pentulose or hexulose) kinase